MCTVTPHQPWHAAIPQQSSRNAHVRMCFPSTKSEQEPGKASPAREVSEARSPLHSAECPACHFSCLSAAGTRTLRPLTGSVPSTWSFLPSLQPGSTSLCPALLTSPVAAGMLYIQPGDTVHPARVPRPWRLFWNASFAGAGLLSAALSIPRA